MTHRIDSGRSHDVWSCRRTVLVEGPDKISIDLYQVTVSIPRLVAARATDGILMERVPTPHGRRPR